MSYSPPKLEFQYFKENKHMPISPIYLKTITVSQSMIDENGHVNNVVYVQWMQDIAVEHYSSLGGVEAQGADSTWVVREHRIEYLLPAFVGEGIEIKTWVENIRRVRSLRRYEFIRKADGKILVKGETDWVFVNIKTGRPQAIPETVINVFNLSQ
ncbi:MAG: thioesterase family protein [Anaerolineales bacterium]